MAYGDSFFITLMAPLELDYDGVNEVSTGWIDIDISYFPSYLYGHFYNFIFDNYYSSGNYVATITTTANGIDTTNDIIYGYNEIQSPNIITRYKIDVRGSSPSDSGYLYLQYLAERIYFDIDETRKPIINILSINRNKISSINGFDQCITRFMSDISLQQWEVRATLPGDRTGHGVGLLVENWTNLNAGRQVDAYILDEELTNGDNDYTISVFGQSVNGVWSD